MTATDMTDGAPNDKTGKWCQQPNKLLGLQKFLVSTCARILPAGNLGFAYYSFAQVLMEITVSWQVLGTACQPPCAQTLEPTAAAAAAVARLLWEAPPQ